MLVLTRYVSPDDPDKSEIHIGDDIVITLLTVRGGSARIGIKAPKDLAIIRPDAIRHEPRPGRERSGH